MEPNGLSMQDEESIMSHFDNFCGRVRQVLDMLHAFYQLHSLQESVFGLPRPRREHISYEDFMRSRAQVTERYQTQREGSNLDSSDEEDDDPNMLDAKGGWGGWIGKRWNR